MGQPHSNEINEKKIGTPYSVILPSFRTTDSGRWSKKVKPMPYSNNFKMALLIAIKSLKNPVNILYFMKLFHLTEESCLNFVKYMELIGNNLMLME